MDDVVLHTNDLVIHIPKYVHDLSVRDIILLPIWGRCEVMHAPRFDPADNREFITLRLRNGARTFSLKCTRNMQFYYLGNAYSVRFNA